MALDSSSTLANALAQYNDNLSWEGDIAKARLALAAVRWLLVNREQTIADGGTQLNYSSLEQEKTALEQFVNSQRSDRSSFTRGSALT